MADFLNIPNTSYEVTRENPYLNSEFSINWDSMGLNNLTNVYNTNQPKSNFMTDTFGQNYLGSLSAIVGSGVTAWGVYKSYKTYKDMDENDYKNELPLMQIDAERESTIAALYANNTDILREATDAINYNAYVQAIDQSKNQAVNETAYSNSIFKVNRQVQQKTDQMYKDIQTLNLNSEAAKNAELVKQRMEYLTTKQAALSILNQNIQSGAANISDYLSQIEMIPGLNKKNQVTADTSVADNLRDPTTFQYYTTQNTLASLKTNGFENSQQYLAANNKVAIGQFEAYLNPKYTGTGLNRSDFRVPNLSEVYFDFD